MTREVCGYGIDPTAADHGIKLVACNIRGVAIKRKHEGLERKRRDVFAATSHRPEDPVLRGYRDLFSALGIENAKASPEWLHQLLARTGKLPRISTAVDAYNLVSLTRNVVLSAHDLAQLDGIVRLQMVEDPELFLPIGGEPEMIPRGEWLIRDDRHVLCRLNCKQSELSKVTFETTDLLVYVQGNRATSDEYLASSIESACELITQFCGGRAERLPLVEVAPTVSGGS